MSEDWDMGYKPLLDLATLALALLAMGAIVVLFGALLALGARLVGGVCG